MRRRRRFWRLRYWLALRAEHYYRRLLHAEPTMANRARYLAARARARRIECEGI